MVATRGKRVDYSKLEDDDSDVEEATTGKPPTSRPPAKKRKVKNADVAEDAVVAKEKRPAIKNKGKKAALKKSGKLEGLMKMPVDIFTEVCQHLSPLDLLHLARASPRLRELLMSKESKAIWKTSRALFDGLPDCPPDLSEPQYASLMFETGCQGCDAGTRKTNYRVRARFCPKCTNANYMNELEVMRAYPSLDRRVIRNMPRTFANEVYPNRRRFYTQSVYLRSLTAGVADRFSQLPRLHTPGGHASHDEQAVITLASELDEERKMMDSTCTLMQIWKNEEADTKQLNNSEASGRRLSAVKEKLLALGWVTADFPSLAVQEWRNLAYRPTELNDQIWKRIHPKLVPLLETQKAYRLAREKEQRRSRRGELIEGYFEEYASNRMEEDPTLRRSIFLRHRDLIKIPSVALIVENDTETVDVGAWTATLEDVRQADNAYQEATKAALWDLVKEGFPLKGSGSAEGNAAQGASPTPSRDECLSFGTAVFKCKECEHGRSMWYPSLLDHVHGVGARRWDYLDISDLTAPAETREILVRLLKDLGLDLYTPATDLLQGDQSYLCACCDERIALPMDLRGLVEHIEKERKWYKQAVEAQAAPRGVAYPDLSMNAALPKIHNTHALDADHPIAVLLTEERIDELRALRTAFLAQSQINAAPTAAAQEEDGDFVPGPSEVDIPLDDDHDVGSASEIGGFGFDEDSEDDDQSEFDFITALDSGKRTCLLCPQGVSREALIPGEMEIHIRTRHLKEPDLEEICSKLQFLITLL